MLIMGPTSHYLLTGSCGDSQSLKSSSPSKSHTRRPLPVTSICMTDTLEHNVSMEGLI
jgi:hypothetical protein